MKDGIPLRQVINVIDEIDFEEYEDSHAFGEILRNDSPQFAERR